MPRVEGNTRPSGPPSRPRSSDSVIAATTNAGNVIVRREESDFGLVCRISRPSTRTTVPATVSVGTSASRSRSASRSARHSPIRRPVPSMVSTICGSSVMFRRPRVRGGRSSRARTALRTVTASRNRSRTPRATPTRTRPASRCPTSNHLRGCSPTSAKPTSKEQHDHGAETTIVDPSHAPLGRRPELLSVEYLSLAFVNPQRYRCEAWHLTNGAAVVIVTDNGGTSLMNASEKVA